MRWPSYLHDILSEDHLLLANQGRVAWRLDIAGEQPHAIRWVRHHLGDRAVHQRDPGARRQLADIDRIAHDPRLRPTPSPPPGAERAGVRWGIPESSLKAHLTRPAAAPRSTLSPLKGEEGNSAAAPIIPPPPGRSCASWRARPNPGRP